MIKNIAIILLAFSGSAFSASDPVIESDVSMQRLSIDYADGHPKAWHKNRV